MWIEIIVANRAARNQKRRAGEINLEALLRSAKNSADSERPEKAKQALRLVECWAGDGSALSGLVFSSEEISPSLQLLRFPCENGMKSLYYSGGKICLQNYHGVSRLAFRRSN